MIASLALVLLAEVPLQRHAVAQQFRLPATLDAAARPTVRNGDFASRKIDGGWIDCGTAPASVSVAPARPGAFAQYSGMRGGRGEPEGDSGVCQAIRVPRDGLLQADLYELSNERDTRFAYQEADLLDRRGNVVVNLYKTVNNVPRWARGTWNLGAYAGNTYWLYFGVHGDGYENATTEQFVRRVVLTGRASSPRE
ncbi:MAG: hypothetical protein JO030_06630 [Candidatus Eremiobacteraeota bacterium]|nr:hypothetical protein [Candidatus Eremiobacteraeota bacterium]